MGAVKDRPREGGREGLQFILQKPLSLQCSALSGLLSLLRGSASTLALGQ